MNALAIVAVILGGWIALVVLARWAVKRWLTDGPSGDPFTTALWRGVQVYCRWRHRAQFHGLEHVPKTNQPGGMIVVSNHTGPIDPLVIQAGCHFDIRWLMAEEMMVESLDWFWRRHRLIPVARDGRDTGPAREAIRTVRAGGIIGIFPEGGIVRPSGEVRPFQAGAGLIVARTGAPVLLVFVSGTPQATEMVPALASTSNTVVRYLDLIDFGGERSAAKITEDLRRRMSEASNWPMNDEPVPQPIAEAGIDPFAVQV